MKMMDRALWAISHCPRTAHAVPNREWRCCYGGGPWKKPIKERQPTRQNKRKQHEANKGNDRQATEHDYTKRNGTRRDETKAAAPTQQTEPAQALQLPNLASMDKAQARSASMKPRPRQGQVTVELPREEPPNEKARTEAAEGQEKKGLHPLFN